MKSYNLSKDVFTGVMFVSGVFGFMSGEFILSTVLFALSTIASNLQPDKKLQA